MAAPVVLCKQGKSERPDKPAAPGAAMPGRWHDVTVHEGEQVIYVYCTMDGPSGWTYHAGKKSLVRVDDIDQDYVVESVAPASGGWNILARSVDSEGTPSARVDKELAVRWVDVERGLPTWGDQLLVEDGKKSGVRKVTQPASECE